MAVSTEVASPPRAPAGERIINRTRFSKREALAGYLFISPWIIGFLVFTLGAMIYSLVISFSRLRPRHEHCEPGRASPTTPGCSKTPR